MVGLTSVGAGSIVVVVLLMMYPRLKASSLVGTDLTQAIPLVAAAAAGHLLFGNFSFAMASSLLRRGDPGRVHRRPYLQPGAGRHHPPRPRGAPACLVAEAPRRADAAVLAAAVAAVLFAFVFVAPDQGPVKRIRGRRDGRGDRAGPRPDCRRRGRRASRSATPAVHDRQRRSRLTPRTSRDLPRVVLDDDGLDRLELVLGWLAAALGVSAPPPRRASSCSPTRRTRRSRSSPGATADGAPAVRPLSPMARGSGPHWDPDVRLSAAGRTRAPG